MLSEGISLARQRRAALAELIKSNPQQALAAAIPASVQLNLPPDIGAELETHVSGIGELSVLGVLQAKGGPAVHPIERSVRLNGQTYRAYVYGRRAVQTSKSGIPLSGIALGDVLALDESPLRELESGGTSEPATPVVDLRNPSQQSAGLQGAALAEVGGKIYRFASREQLQQAKAQLEAAEAGISPVPTRSAATVLEQSAQSPAPNGGSPAPGPPSPWTTGLKNVLVIRVDFSDLPGDPATAAFCQSLMDNQISPYYLTSSYGLTSLSNTVTTQLYRMPQTAAAYATGDLNDQLHIDAETAAAANYNVSSYDRIIVLFSYLGNIPGSFINYGGLAQVVGKNVWVNGEFDFRVVAHELGHTYGLFHAGLWLVSDGNPLSPTGTTVEYGDDFDTMGANFANDPNTDFSGYYKNILGWLPDSKVLTITTNGVYRIYAFDWANYAGVTNDAVLALKLVKDGERTYWIGARRNFTGNPTMEHGAYIIWGLNTVGGGSGGGFLSDLLDLNTPGTAPVAGVNSDYDSALTIGQTFTDPAISFMIKPIAEGGTGPNKYLDLQVGEATDLRVVTNTVSGGNGNGVIDNNECNDLFLLLTNSGSLTATHIQATLSTTNPGVVLTQSKSGYPDLPVGASADNLLAFRISTAPFFVCGTPIDCNLLIKCDQATVTTQVRLPTGTPGTALRFDHSTPEAIPDGGETNSLIVVSNVTSALNKVTVALYITHTYDADLLIQLISPDGTTNTLSANNGSFGHDYGAACSPDAQRTTFDDAALVPISAGAPPFVGTFQPQTPLSVFVGKAGTNINGNWRLRVVDQVFQDVGILQCWSLFLSPAQCKDGGGECPGADLAIGMTAQPEPVLVGTPLTYTISVTNNGPSSAQHVTVTHVLPSGVIFISATSSQGSCSQAGGIVTGNLGTLNYAGRATITVVVMPATTGTVLSTANVTSDQSDPDPSNNSVTVFSHVNPVSVDLVVGLVAIPNSVIIGGTLTYTVAVTNNGPSPGSGIFVTNVLPSSVAVLSATVSQGSITTGGGLWSLGALAAGARATATITVIPAAEGIITTTSTAAGNQFDPVAGNNTVSVSTVVGAAADLAIGIADFPDPVIVGSNVTYVISVTNLGPSAATSVSVNDSFTPDLTVLVTNASQGAVSVSGGTLTWALGTLASGAKATLTVIAMTATNETLVSTATVSATQADPNPANNSATATTQVAPPGVAIAAAGVTLTAESFFPPNGAIDIGETVSVILRLRNISNISTLNLVGTLLATNGVAPAAPTTQTYGVLAPSGFPVGRAFTFTASGTNGQTIHPTLQLQDGPTTYPPVSFNITLPITQVSANPNTIVIPDPAAPNPPYPLESGPGKPYPSLITVSNLNGLLGKVTVTLSNLSHDYPGDINVLLVGPTGAKTLLMSHAGTLPVTGLNLTFDDSAAGPLPDTGELASGVWQVSAYGVAPAFPTNAPAGPYPAALSSFNATSPNGTWSLYVFDDSGGDAGNMFGGWSLALSMITPINQLADLSLSGVGAPNPVLAGAALTYTFTVANSGPSAATSVAFSNTVPAGVTLVSAIPSQGIAIPNGNTVLAVLGTLNTGAVATVTVVVIPTPSAFPPGNNTVSLTSTATVGCNETDPNPANNTASVVTTAKLPLADVGVSLAATPEPAATGNNLTNTIVVTNYGSSVALGVVVTDPLPAGMTFVSASSTVGTCSNSSGTVICSLGDLSASAGATVSLIVSNTLLGSITNTVSATTASQDTNSANNTATYVAHVIGPTASIIGAGAVLTFESGPVNALIDPGETVGLSLSLANVGTLDTVNLKATLLGSGGVTGASGPQDYGALIHGGPSTARSYTFTAASVVGSAVVATLQLQDERSGVTNSLGTVAFTFNQPFTSGWSNAAPLTIPDHGVATPYPSTITVSGLTGVVTKATVTINGLTHAFPHDVNVLLVSPTGGNALVMSHVGGGHSVSNLTLTFDDAVTNTLPNSDLLTAGTYHPSSYPGAVGFPSPAAAGPNPSALAGVAGYGPNGAWSLYVFDDAAGDGGYIAGGWNLNITTAATLRPIADLAVSMSSAPVSFFIGGALTTTVWVTNLGPASATGIMVTNTLSSGQQVITNLGNLTTGATAKVIFLIAPAEAGNVLDTVSVGGNEADLDSANNSAQSTTAVLTPAPAILSGSFVNGQFRLTATAQPGLTYAVLVSTDLTSWVTVINITASPGGTIKFTDTASPNTQRRFYRIQRLIP